MASQDQATAGSAAPDPQALVIDMSLSWTNVKDQRSMSHGWLTPVLVYSVCDGGDRSVYVEHGRSTPGASTAEFKTSYRFGEALMLRFELVNQHRLRGFGESLGRVFCTPLDLVVYLNTPYKRTLLLESGARSSGSLVIFPTAPKWPTGFTALQLSAEHMPLKKVFHTADGMLEMWKQDRYGDSTCVYTTEVVHNSTAPTWKTFVVNKDRLGDDSDSIIFKCFDVNFAGDRLYLGQVTTSVKQLSRGTDTRLELACEQDGADKLTQPPKPVTLRVDHYKDFPWSFIDYMHGEFSINFSYILDLSSSNMDANSSFRSQYEAGIRIFDEVIQQYDEEQLIPALGFGAKIPPSVMSQGLIFLNGTQNPRCKGVQGVLDAYNDALKRVTPSEPSELSSSLNYIVDLAKNFEQSSKYYIVIVLTDGKLDYGLSTIETLVKTSSAAMSVILVGIGDGDFKFFDELRPDNIRKNGAIPDREFIKCVTLKDYRDRMHELPRDSLKGVPDQILQFLALRNIEPNITFPPT